MSLALYSSVSVHELHAFHSLKKTSNNNNNKIRIINKAQKPKLLEFVKESDLMPKSSFTYYSIISINIFNRKSTSFKNT